MREKRIVVIKKTNRRFWLFIDGVRHDEFFDYNERLIFLKRAIKKFDDDFEKVAVENINHPLGAFLWLYTSEFIRGEEITSLFRWHYLKEMLDFLNYKRNISIVQINSRLPKSMIFYFHQNAIPVKTNILPTTISYLKYWASGISRVSKAIIKNFHWIFSKRNYYHKSVIADINRSFTKHRYDSIEKIIAKYPDSKFFSGQEHPLENLSPEDMVIFRKELNPLIFIQSVKDTFKLAVFVKKNKHKIPYDLYCNLADTFNLLLWVDLVIFKKCVERYFDHNPITKVFHVSTLTRPTYRLLMSEARKRGVEFTLVASRTLMSYRASERLLNCDVNEYNDTALPDRFIFKDHYSKKVFEQYPQLISKVKVGGRYNIPEVKVNEAKETAIMILFNHFEEIVYKLLDEVVASGAHNISKTIMYRFHPAYRIDADEMKKKFPENTLIDITGQDYSKVKDFKTLCISGPTTGALDAVQAGTLLVWVPYIWEDGIVLDDIMSNIGIKCANGSQLKDSLKFLTNDQKYKEVLLKDQNYLNHFFNTNQLISECI